MYWSKAVLPGAASASLILASAASHFFLEMLSCAALSGTPTFWLTFCCASAVAGIISIVPATPTQPAIASAPVRTKLALLIEFLTGTFTPR